jgi:hypothetical protein
VKPEFVNDSIDATVLKDGRGAAYDLAQHVRGDVSSARAPSTPKKSAAAAGASAATSSKSATTTATAATTKRKDAPTATSSSGKAKVLVKGRAAVDPMSGLQHSCHVVDEGGDNGVWDAMLNQVELVWC